MSMRRTLFGMKSAVDRGPASSVYIILFLQSLMASGTHLVAKVIVAEVDPFTLTLVRSLIAAAGMGVVLLLRGRPVRIAREDMVLVLLLGLLAIPINQFLFLVGMSWTIPSNAALLYATTPILVLLFSRWFMKEKMTRRKVAGVALGFAGVLIVIFERGIETSMQYVAGNLIVYCAVIAWGLYTVFGKRLIVTYGPIVASSYTLLAGTLLFIPIGLVPALAFPYEVLSAVDWAHVAYLGLVTSVLGYLLWYYALGRIEAGKVALFANLQPVLTTLMAMALLGQDVTLAFIAGGIVALSGVVLAQFG